MSRAAFTKSLADLDVVSRFLDLSEDLRAALATVGTGLIRLEPSSCPLTSFSRTYPTSSESRLTDHCFAYTRVYAILENFVYQRLISILSFWENNVSYNSLPSSIKGSFRRGIADILSNIEKDRYSSFTEDELIKNYHFALGRGGASYVLTPQAVLRNEQNYRLDEIARLFNICGIAGIKDWVNGHRDILDFFASESRESGTAEAYLRSLVNFRNSAAHGSIDEISSTKLLHEAVLFIRIIVSALYERSQSFLLDGYLRHGKLIPAGEVLNSFKSNAVVATWTRGRLSLGDWLVAGGPSKLKLMQVLELQFDGHAVGYLNGGSHLEAGIRLSERVKAGKSLWRFSENADISAL